MKKIITITSFFIFALVLGLSSMPEKADAMYSVSFGIGFGNSGYNNGYVDPYSYGYAPYYNSRPTIGNSYRGGYQTYNNYNYQPTYGYNSYYNSRPTINTYPRPTNNGYYGGYPTYNYGGGVNCSISFSFGC